MSEADYPYTGKDKCLWCDSRECATDPNATTVSTTADWSLIRDVNRTTFSDVIDALKDGPMPVYVGAGNDCWRFYKEGILSDETCPTRFDHAVTLVGYTAAVTSEGTEGETTCRTTKRRCRNAGKKEIENNKCWKRRGGDAIWTSKWGKVKCCTEGKEKCTTSEPTEGEVTTPAFWTIQNSWGD